MSPSITLAALETSPMSVYIIFLVSRESLQFPQVSKLALILKILSPPLLPNNHHAFHQGASSHRPRRFSLGRTSTSPEMCSTDPLCLCVSRILPDHQPHGPAGASEASIRLLEAILRPSFGGEDETQQVFVPLHALYPSPN